MDNALPAFPSFDFEADRANAGTRWKKWVSRLDNLFVGMDLDDDHRKRALLLHYAGERVFEIYDAEKGTTEITYAATKKVLSDYFEPKKNLQMEIYTFRSCKQTEGQSLDDFVTELRTLAKNCEFANVDKEILSQVIQHCKSNRLRRRALRETNKTLTDILDIGRSLELSEVHASVMERESVNKVWDNDQRSRNKKQYPDQKHRNTQQYRAREPDPNGSRRRQDQRESVHIKDKCTFCGGEYPHKGPCPAKGKTCNYCKMPNHFKSVCLKLKFKHVNSLEEQPVSKAYTRQKHNSEANAYASSSDEDTYCYTIHDHQVNKVNSGPLVSVRINDVWVDKIMLDTGASVNILDEKVYDAVGKPTLRKKPTRLFPYGGVQPLHVLGVCELTVETKSQIQCHQFYVVKGAHGSLLGYQTAQDLKLVNIVNTISEHWDTKFPKVFKGIGKLKGSQVKLHIDETVRPVAITNRRTPFHLRGKVEDEINNLMDEDIIERVSGEATPWVSPIVTPPKRDGSIRLCVDMREPNKAIQRERHNIPTLDELIYDLNPYMTSLSAT